MIPVEIALVGCHNATELVGRVCTSILGAYITAADMVSAFELEGKSAVQAYPILEELIPVRFVDVLGDDAKPSIVTPTRPCTVTFQSRLNQRVRCTFYNVSPETFAELAQDMVSSTLWYLDGVTEH